MPKQSNSSIVKHNNSRLLSVFNFFAPSALDVSIYVVIFVITVIINQLPQYKINIQDFHLTDLQGTFAYRYVSDVTHFINTQLANNLAIYIFWVVIASLIYIAAARTVRNGAELAQDVNARNYIWPKGSDHKAPLKEFAEKFVFRVIMIIVFVVYLVKVGPLLTKIWREHSFNLKVSLHNLESLGILLAAEIIFIQLLVIIMRLFLIKRRIFSF